MRYCTKSQFGTRMKRHASAVSYLADGIKVKS